MFDLFEVFVKQLFQNPKHYYVRAGGNPKPQLAPAHSNMNASVPSPSAIFTSQTIFTQARPQSQTGPLHVQAETKCSKLSASLGNH